MTVNFILRSSIAALSLLAFQGCFDNTSDKDTSNSDNSHAITQEAFDKYSPATGFFRLQDGGYNIVGANVYSDGMEAVEECNASGYCIGYRFDIERRPLGAVASSGGKLDLNNNGKPDIFEPDAVNIYSGYGYNYLTSFTALSSIHFNFNNSLYAPISSHQPLYDFNTLDVVNDSLPLYKSLTTATIDHALYTSDDEEVNFMVNLSNLSEEECIKYQGTMLADGICSVDGNNIEALISDKNALIGKINLPIKKDVCDTIKGSFVEKTDGKDAYCTTDVNGTMALVDYSVEEANALPRDIVLSGFTESDCNGGGGVWSSSDRTCTITDETTNSFVNYISNLNNSVTVSITNSECISASGTWTGSSCILDSGGVNRLVNNIKNSPRVYFFSSLDSATCTNGGGLYSLQTGSCSLNENQLQGMVDHLYSDGVADGPLRGSIAIPGATQERCQELSGVLDANATTCVVSSQNVSNFLKTYAVVNEQTYTAVSINGSECGSLGGDYTLVSGVCTFDKDHIQNFVDYVETSGATPSADVNISIKGVTPADCSGMSGSWDYNATICTVTAMPNKIGEVDALILDYFGVSTYTYSGIGNTITIGAPHLRAEVGAVSYKKYWRDYYKYQLVQCLSRECVTNILTDTLEKAKELNGN